MTIRSLLIVLAAAVSVAAFGLTHPVLAQSTDPAELATEGYDAETKGDFANALRLYRVAALAGNPYAQGNLANMLRDGRGTAKDPAEAMRWYQKAAAQNHADSQFGIGFMYENGLGVKQDLAQAAKWYRLAADQGDIGAQVSLATLYAAGTGVEPDRIQAYMWFTLAAAKDDTAKRRAATLAQRMTPDQIAKAQQMVKDWKPKEAPKKP